jgi:hypothetical protein
MASRRRRRRRPTRRAAPALARLGAGEARLLALARDLAALTATSPPARLLDAALEKLARAAGPMTSNRRDKTRALATAWAHEQARLAMQEILEREARRGALRGDLPRPLLAWLLIAARDALAHEPPDALDERLQALGRFLRLTPGKVGG